MLFGKGELFVDMSSFNTNMLSEKVPVFSMAVGQEKRVLKWKEPDEIWKELAYPLYVKKMHKKNQETCTKNENGSWSLLFCESRIQ